MNGDRIRKIWRLWLFGLLVLLVLAFPFSALTQDDPRDLLLRASLKVDNKAGIFTRATASNCRLPGAATYTALAAGEVCRSATDGLRLDRAATNILGPSKNIAGWTGMGAGTTITANDSAGPSGAVEAERVQFAAASNFVYKSITTSALQPDIVVSVWLRTHAGGASCTLDLGTVSPSGGIYYGGLSTLTSSWDRYWVRIVGGSAAGGMTVHWLAVSNYATATGHGTPTCTDFDIIDAQDEINQLGPGQYCSTGAGAGPATCNAETVTWPSYKNIRASKGTFTFAFTASELASWDIYADSYFWSVPIDGGGVFGAWFDRSSSECVFTANNQSARVPCTWAPGTTGHTLSVSWAGGQAVTARWDDQYPGVSAGAYTVPTFTAGGVITLGGAIDGFYSNVNIYRSQRTPNSITVASFAPLESTLAMTYPPAAVAWTYTGGASTCLDSGGQSMSDKGNNVACYFDAGGDARGVRVSPAWTNLEQGDTDGVDGACPTSFTCVGPGPLVNTGVLFHGQVAQKIRTTAPPGAEVDYVTAPGAPGVSTRTFSRYIKITSLTTVGFLLTITEGWLTYFGHPVTNTSWARYWGTYNWSTPRQLLGFSDTVFTGPNVGTVIAYDAISLSNSSYAPPFCAGGAPPVTCTAESLSRAFGAELSATAYTIDLDVTTMFGAGSDKGNSGINFGNARGTSAYLIANTGYNAQWNNANRTWVFTDGTQTATSAAQTFPPDSTHHLQLIAVDGAPLSLQVNKQTAVVSAGNKAPQALGATTYILTHAAGGAELGGWVRRVTVR